MALSLTYFRNKPSSTPDWIIPNFLTRQNTAFIIGPPKRACKSWLLLAAAWELSEGKPVWGIESMTPPRPMRTVYFTQEDTEDDIDIRIKAHFSTGRGDHDRVLIVPKNLSIKLDTTDGRRIVERELDAVVEKAGAIDLVMFDPMRRIHNGNENDSDTIAKIWDVLDRVHRRYGCAVVISHHITKPPRDKAGYDPTDAFNGRGSGDIYGGGDAFVVVVPGPMRKDKMGRRVTAYFESKRAREMEPAHLDVSFETGAVVSVANAPLLPLIKSSYDDIQGASHVDLRRV